MSDKIKVGIWGLGRAGIEAHAKEMELYPELFEIVAGCDPDRERRLLMQKKYSGKTYDNPEAFLLAPEIELISIATRSTEHVKHALQALAAGKYVFLEKPIALNHADAVKLLEADKRFPGKLYLRHNRRFEAPFVRINEIISSGILGEVYEIKLHRHNYQRRNDWQTIIACGGGLLNNWGPHIIDHALRFINGPVKEVWSDLKKVAAAGDAEDHLKIILRGETGLVVDLEISGGIALPEPEYVIHGSKGSLICSGNDIKLKYINPVQQLPFIEAESGNPSLSDGYTNFEKIDWIEENVKVRPKETCDTHSIWKYLYQSIRVGKPFPISLEQGIEVVKLSERVKQNTQFVA